MILNMVKTNMLRRVPRLRCTEELKQIKLGRRIKRLQYSQSIFTSPGKKSFLKACLIGAKPIAKMADLEDSEFVFD